MAGLTNASEMSHLNKMCQVSPDLYAEYSQNQCIKLLASPISGDTDHQIVVPIQLSSIKPSLQMANPDYQSCLSPTTISSSFHVLNSFPQQDHSPEYHEQELLFLFISVQGFSQI